MIKFPEEGEAAESGERTAWSSSSSEFCVSLRALASPAL